MNQLLSKLADLLRQLLQDVKESMKEPIPKVIKPIVNPVPEPVAFTWDSPLLARHAVRVICDEEGLDVNTKNILTACVQVESGFKPKAIGKPNKDGTRDWGICQFNDGKNKQGIPFWIGAGAAFPSTDFVLNNPEKCVRLMAKLFKQGEMSLWASYNSGAYKRYL